MLAESCGGMSDGAQTAVRAALTCKEELAPPEMQYHLANHEFGRQQLGGSTSIPLERVQSDKSQCIYV